MRPVAILVLLVVGLSACTAAQPTQPAGQTQPAGESQPATAGNGGGASVAEAALKVKDWCTVMPADLAAKIVPDGSAPQSQLFLPLKCTVTNQVSVLEITFLNSASTDPVAGAEPIEGLAEAAYYESLSPADAYLTIMLGADSRAVLYVEVAGHDGKDHKDDAIAVAKAVLAQLQ